MVSKIEPDRYADTGFAVKDTAPEVNAWLFAAMMRKSPGERMMMGFDMAATARALVWSGIARNLPEQERQRLFYQRFYGEPCPV
ncbi:MAG: hypothetical protein JWO94_218 [Verrucomicrobiaceae bacterium]|nr:hypothetical protein [Verrucomicrobiaceae bacterium]